MTDNILDNELNGELTAPVEYAMEYVMEEELLQEMTDEDIAFMGLMIEKINQGLLERNIEFSKLIREESTEKPLIEEKIKELKPKKIKIPKLLYNQIKSHCEENKVSIEDWITRVSLNEINRIITRIGDIDYSLFRSLTLTKNNKKKKK